MKKSFVIALALVAIAAPIWADDFVSLRQDISEMLAETCDCSPISDNPDIGRLFTVKMRDGRGFNIFVRERAFFTPKEWAAKSSELKALLDKFSKAKQTDAFPSKDVQAAMSIWTRLPSFSYKRIGLDIYIEYPEYASPDNERRGKISEDILMRIQTLLTPYKEG